MTTNSRLHDYRFQVENLPPLGVMTTDSMQSDRAGTSHDYKFHALPTKAAWPYDYRFHAEMTSGKPHDYRFQVEKMARIELS